MTELGMQEEALARAIRAAWPSWRGYWGQGRRPDFIENAIQVARKLFRFQHRNLADAVFPIDRIALQPVIGLPEWIIKRALVFLSEISVLKLMSALQQRGKDNLGLNPRAKWWWNKPHQWSWGDAVFGVVEAVSAKIAALSSKTVTGQEETSNLREQEQELVPLVSLESKVLSGYDRKLEGWDREAARRAGENGWSDDMRREFMDAQGILYEQRHQGDLSDEAMEDALHDLWVIMNDRHTAIIERGRRKVLPQKLAPTPVLKLSKRAAPSIPNAVKITKAEDVHLAQAQAVCDGKLDPLEIWPMPDWWERGMAAWRDLQVQEAAMFVRDVLRRRAGRHAY